MRLSYNLYSYLLFEIYYIWVANDKFWVANYAIFCKILYF